MWKQEVLRNDKQTASDIRIENIWQTVGIFATTCFNIQKIYKLTRFYLGVSSDSGIAAAAAPYLTRINQLCLHKRRLTHQQLTSKYAAYNV
jgi:hypothetical protein